MMKNKKKIIVSLSAIILSLTTVMSVTIIAVNSAYGSREKNVDTIVANEVCEMENLEDVKHEGKLMIGSYERKEAELNDMISNAESRITLNEVEKMIDSGMNYHDIESQLLKEYPYPDFSGGSGILRYEYWIDETGNNKIILFHEQEDIMHVVDSPENSEVVCDVLLE